MAEKDDDCDQTSPCPSGGTCDGDGSCSTRRRAVLGTLAGGSLTALAGCVGVFGEPEERTTPPRDETVTYDIAFENESETIGVDSDEYLLEAGEAQGWDLPYFCRTGFCGACVGQVDGDGSELVDMSINQVDSLTEEAIEAGFVLTCTGRPRGDFTLETGMSGALDTFIEETTEYAIDYVNEGDTIDVRGDESLLVAGEDQGWDLPYACRQGFCGQCTARVDGDGHELVEITNNEVDGLTDEAISDGYVLTCVGYPRGDVELETGQADALDDYIEDEADTTHRVDYINEQWSIEVPADESLLEAGEARGLDLPYSCRQGFCGQCLAKVDGDGHELVEMTNNQVDGLDDEAIEEGYVLTCVGYPRGDMELESGRAGELD